jgi:hypothetical protein
MSMAHYFINILLVATTGKARSVPMIAVATHLLPLSDRGLIVLGFYHCGIMNAYARLVTLHTEFVSDACGGSDQIWEHVTPVNE